MLIIRISGHNSTGKIVFILWRVIAILFVASILDISIRSGPINPVEYWKYYCSILSISVVVIVATTIKRKMEILKGKDAIYLQDSTITSRSPITEKIRIDSISLMEIKPSPTRLFKNNEVLILKSSDKREMRIHSSYHDRPLVEIMKHIEILMRTRR